PTRPRHPPPSPLPRTPHDDTGSRTASPPTRARSQTPYSPPPPRHAGQKRRQPAGKWIGGGKSGSFDPHDSHHPTKIATPEFVPRSFSGRANRRAGLIIFPLTSSILSVSIK